MVRGEKDGFDSVNDRLIFSYPAPNVRRYSKIRAAVDEEGILTFDGSKRDWMRDKFRL